MKRLNFDVSDNMYIRMQKAIQEGCFLRMSELSRAGIEIILEKRGF